VNFLPYPKGNRDEWISKAELEEKICGAFLNNDSISNKETDSVNKAIRGLREYFENKFNKSGEKADSNSSSGANAKEHSKNAQSKVIPTNQKVNSKSQTSTQKKEEIKSKQSNDKQQDKT